MPVNNILKVTTTINKLMAVPRGNSFIWATQVCAAEQAGMLFRVLNHTNTPFILVS